MLGDAVARALSLVGVTENRVEWWLGQPCSCAERKAKLNALDAWARRIIAGRLEKAEEYLDRILGGE
jgi:hypothetical protein